VRFPVSTWKDKVLAVSYMAGGGSVTPVRGATTAGNSRKSDASTVLYNELCQDESFHSSGKGWVRPVQSRQTI
jgi:hypothetical protein